MCRSMVDIQSVAAEIRRGKKKKEERRKIEITGKKYNGLVIRNEDDVVGRTRVTADEERVLRGG